MTDVEMNHAAEAANSKPEKLYRFLPTTKQTTTLTTLQPDHRLKTNTLHLRPRPPNSQRPKPTRALPDRTAKHIPEIRRPRRHPMPPKPTPNHLPHNHLRRQRRPPHPPTRTNQTPPPQAAPNPETTHKMGTLRAQEGHRQVQHQTRRGTGGPRATQEAGLRRGVGRVGAAVGV